MERQFASEAQSFEQPVTLDFTQDVWQASQILNLISNPGLCRTLLSVITPPSRCSPQRWNGESRGEGERWLRKELSCVLIQWGCHNKSEEMRVFLLEANRSYCFTWCIQHVRCSSFQLCYFPPYAGAVGCSELNFIFFFIKDFFFLFQCVYLDGKKNVFASSSTGLISCRSAWKLSLPRFIGFSCHFDFSGVQSVFPRSMLEIRFNTE